VFYHLEQHAACTSFIGEARSGADPSLINFLLYRSNRTIDMHRFGQPLASFVTLITARLRKTG
jgi:hypothetical protein